MDSSLADRLSATVDGGLQPLLRDIALGRRADPGVEDQSQRVVAHLARSLHSLDVQLRIEEVLS